MFFRILQIAVPFIWFGSVAAISFLEAPLKFSAPNITLELGLGIGQIVFHAMNKVEIVLCLLAAGSLAFAKPAGKWILVIFGSAAAILAVQTFVLFPILDERTAAVLAGTVAPYSGFHIYFIVAEAVKLILILALGIFTARANLKLS